MSAVIKLPESRLQRRLVELEFARKLVQAQIANLCPRKERNVVTGAECDLQGALLQEVEQAIDAVRAAYLGGDVLDLGDALGTWHSVQHRVQSYTTADSEIMQKLGRTLRGWDGGHRSQAEESEPLRKEALRLRQENPKLSGARIGKMLKVPATTVNYWLRKSRQK